MNCKLCNGSKLEEIIVKNRSWEKKYFVCNECGFTFLETNSILKDFEQLERYKMHQNKLEDTVYRNYFKKFIEYSFKNIYDRKKILDFGSGPEPVLADVLKTYGHDVYIYDKFFSENESVLYQKYEVITSTEVLEHIEFPMETLINFINLLEERGYIIIMTCFNNNAFKNFKNWWYIQDPTHISFFNSKTFEYIANKLKLEIIDTNNKNIIIMKRR